MCRYQKEMAVYTKSHAYKQFLEQQKLQGQQPPTLPSGVHAPSTGIASPLTSPQQENKRQRKEPQHHASPANSNSSGVVNISSDSPVKVNGCSNDEDELVSGKLVQISRARIFVHIQSNIISTICAHELNIGRKLLNLFITESFVSLMTLCLFLCILIILNSWD